MDDLIEDSRHASGDLGDGAARYADLGRPEAEHRAPGPASEYFKGVSDNLRNLAMALPLRERHDVPEPEPDALRLSQLVALRARQSEATVLTSENSQPVPTAEEMSIRTTLSNTLGEATKYLAYEEDNSEPGPKVLLDTHGMPRRQVGALCHELENIFAALPEEKGPGQAFTMTTAIPNVRLIYAPSDSGDPNEIKIALWRAHPATRDRDWSPYDKMPANWEPPAPQPPQPRFIPKEGVAPPSREQHWAPDSPAAFYTGLADQVIRAGQRDHVPDEISELAHRIRRHGERASHSTQGDPKLEREVQIDLTDALVRASVFIDPPNQAMPLRDHEVIWDGSEKVTDGTREFLIQLENVLGASSRSERRREGPVTISTMGTFLPGIHLQYRHYPRDEHGEGAFFVMLLRA